MRKKIEMNKSNTTKTFDRGFDEFIIYCKARNLSLATIKHYDNIINHAFYKFLDYKTPISDISSSTVSDFILFCREKMQEKDVTINTNIRVLRAIMHYFMKMGYMKEFKIQDTKVTKEIIDTYSDEELKILLKRPDVKHCNFIEYRNWVIVNFMLAIGCRIQTPVNINISD